MCGIVAVVPLKAGLGQAELKRRSIRMAETIAHRGPDADGCWVDPAGRIALAHRRLSIIDLSPAGMQPMASVSGRYTIVFNGEIYNYAALRADLSPQAWRGHSDTEVLLAAIETFGIEAALTRCVGMFATAMLQSTAAITHDFEIIEDQ